MNPGELLSHLGQPASAPATKRALEAVGVEVVPRAGEDDEHVVVELPGRGVTLFFEPLELGDTDRLALSEVRFELAPTDGGAAFSGALPRGLARDASRRDLHDELGAPTSACAELGMDTWEADDGAILVEYDSMAPADGRVRSVSFSAPQRPPGPPRLGWSLFGFSIETAPRHIGVRVAPPEVVGDAAGRRVLEASSFEHDDDDRLVAVADGLSDERTFGPLSRDTEGRPRLVSFDDVRPQDRPQAWRFGSLELPERMVHPWVERHGGRLLSRVTGLDPEQLRGVLDHDLAVVRRGGRRWETVSSLEEAASGDDALFGADAIAWLAGDDLPPGVVVDTLPILPAGLRPSIEGDDGRLLVHPITLLYDHLLPYRARRLRLAELGAPRIIMLGESRFARASLEACLLDGLVKTDDPDLPYRPLPRDEDEDEDEDDEDEEARPVRARADVPSLAAFLRGEYGAAPSSLEVLDRNIVEQPALLSAGVFHDVRAWFDASALEIVPLRDDGEVDEERLARTRIDRLAHRFSHAYDAIVGIDFVMHPSHERPHADVYVTPARGDGTRLMITGGMSAVAMEVPRDRGRAHVELAMIVPAELERPVLEELAFGLGHVARFPTKRGRFLAPGHDIQLPRPIVAGSALEAFVVTACSGEPWTSLADAVPRSPAYLLVVGVTPDERRDAARGGAKAIDALVEELAGTTDPRRRSPA